MVAFTVAEAVSACGGKYAGAENILKMNITDVVIDSRKAVPGCLFVPVRGERHDGHDFLGAAREAGAICCLTERPLDAGPHILVGSALEALHRIAEYYRSLFPIPVVGVTGSAGKTTTKELIALVLSKKYNVLKTEGNLNNQTGVPLTVFRLAPEHEAAVIEMGMNRFGEIRNLSRIARPRVCVLTNVGEAHIEFLGSKEGILAAKSEMLEYMEPEGTAVINGDDPLLLTLTRKYPDAVTYGFGKRNRIRAERVYESGFEGSRFTARYEGKEAEIFVPAPGRHMIQNALAALAAGRLLNVEDELIIEGIASYRPAAGRMHVTDTGKIRIINDAYNANPASMAAGISVAAKAPGRSVCILGDMFELGERGAGYHREIGRHAAREGVGLVICVGELSKNIYEEAARNGAKALYFKDKEELVKELSSLIEPGDTVFVKASHGMRLEETAKWLEENIK